MKLDPTALVECTCGEQASPWDSVAAALIILGLLVFAYFVIRSVDR